MKPLFDNNCAVVTSRYQNPYFLNVEKNNDRVVTDKITQDSSIEDIEQIVKKDLAIVAEKFLHTDKK